MPGDKKGQQAYIKLELASKASFTHMVYERAMFLCVLSHQALHAVNLSKCMGIPSAAQTQTLLGEWPQMPVKLGQVAASVPICKLQASVPM